MSERQQLEVTSRAQWRAWLANRHQSCAGVWVVTLKKSAAGHAHVSYDDIAEEAVAFGWVDSQPRRLDAARSMLLVTPRNPKANWSRVNKARVDRLEAAGLMTDAGRSAVALAKDTGTWTALDAVENLEEPEDLQAALDADADARRNWNAFPRSTKRAILEWIATAKVPATRERRVRQTAEQAAHGVRANQPRQPKRSR